MSFFSDNLKNLNIYNSSDDGFSLRQAQIGAFQSVCAHFTVSEEIASVIIPTGVGKTATMSLLPFGLKSQRVLIIAPSKTVRGQIYDEFENLNNLKKFNIYNENETPKVKELKKSISSYDEWNELKDYEVVVSTPHCISSKYNHVLHPVEEIKQTLFDLIIIDEAHHIPAETWDHILKQFPNAKKVLFTATPFRRDGKVLPGTQVYAYPLKKAIENNYYGEVEYIPLEINPNDKNKDYLLAKKAKEQFEQIKRQEPRIKILIKTDKRENTKDLKEIYDSVGLKTEIVTSDYAYSTNKKKIEKLKQSGDLNGLICVDMLGEGFDLPELKIAVLHVPPKSLLPFVQFIGRIARILSKDNPTAYLIADKNAFSKEISKITDDFTNLSKIVPNLIDSLVIERKRKRTYYTEFERDTEGKENSISLENIRPSYTVTLYSINRKNINFNNDIKLSGNVEIYDHQHKESLHVVITQKKAKPKWTNSNLLKSTEFQLNIFYYDNEKEILFHHTTNEAVGNDLIKSFCTDTLNFRKLGANNIIQLMQKAKKAEYINIGVKNLLNLIGSSYENYMGNDSQNSINTLESGCKCVGHAFGKLEFENYKELRGISPFNAKVWSFQRSDIESFHSWCITLSNEINNCIENNYELPDLLLKANLEILQEIKGEEILCLILPDNCYNQSYEIKKTNASNNTPEIVENILNIDFKLNKINETTIKIDLYKDNNKFYSIDYNPLKQQVPFNDDSSSENANFYISNEKESYKISQFFNEFNPTIITNEGESLMGNCVVRIFEEDIKLPESEIFEIINWSEHGVNIKKETYFDDESDDNQSIFSYIKKDLKESFHQSFIIEDDGSGEIADFIVINDNHIGFYHCKAAKEISAGLRVDEFYVLIGQAIRSNKWIRKNKLLDQIIKRIEKKPERLIQGNIDDLKNIGKSFFSYNYTVHLVQPGLSYNSLITSESKEVKKLIGIGYEGVKRYAKFKVICNA